MAHLLKRVDSKRFKPEDIEDPNEGFASVVVHQFLVAPRDEPAKEAAIHRLGQRIARIASLLEC